MYKTKKNIFYDSWVMFKRCFVISMRNPEALLMAIITPIFLMFLFVAVIGNISDVGDLNYIDFIVPGIILQSLGQASQHSAINVTTDMARGIIDRFRSMSISRSAVIIGHVGAGAVRNIVTSIIIICTAFIIGFRPKGSFIDWLMVVLLLILTSIAISLVAVLCGLISKTPEGSSGLMFPLFILPFISSGFAPVDTMTGAVRWFAGKQPMTPIIDSFRALTLGLPLGNSFLLALVWCVGIIIVAFMASARVYQHRSS